MKPYHEELSSKAWYMWLSYYPKTFAFEGSKLLLDLCLADSRILYFWYVLESIHKFIIELHALQCLFVRGLIKNKEGEGLFQISQKERLSSLMTTKYSWGNLIILPSFLHLSKKASLYPVFQFGQEENVPGHSIERRAYLFILNIARMFPIPSSRNRMVNTFIIVNITPSHLETTLFPIPKGPSFSLQFGQ